MINVPAEEASILTVIAQSNAAQLKLHDYTGLDYVLEDASKDVKAIGMYMLHGTPTRKELQKAGDDLISWTKPLPNKTYGKRGIISS